MIVLSSCTAILLECDRMSLATLYYALRGKQYSYPYSYWSRIMTTGYE